MAMERLARTVLALLKESRTLGGDGLMCFNAICGRVNKQATKMNEAIIRVREMHYKYNAGCSCCDSVQYECAHCLTDYPCPTIKALDG